MDVKSNELHSIGDKRNKYEEIFRLLLLKIDHDNPERCEFENDVFKLSPYVWGCSCPEADGMENHIQSCEYDIPNFLFKPTGYKLCWYKYPLRAAEESMDLSDMDMMDMINQCLQSLD